MGEWVERNCRDARGAGGYTAGFEGWEPSPTKLTYKATEHNIDLYAAFQRLYLITGEECWREQASHAKRFILAMWDKMEGKFWAGTQEDGVTINNEVVPLDVQAWAVLAFKEGEGKPYWKALEYAQRHQRAGKGFDFNADCDGIWYEGTAHMALAYNFTRQGAKWRDLIDFLRSAQEEGGLPAADRDGLTTGFDWFYFRRLHVGATAWLVLAEHGVNPFWFGTDLTRFGGHPDTWSNPRKGDATDAEDKTTVSAGVSGGSRALGARKRQDQDNDGGGPGFGGVHRVTASSDPAV